MARSPLRNAAAYLAAAFLLAGLRPFPALAQSGPAPTPGTVSFSATLDDRGTERRYVVIRPLLALPGAPMIILLHPLDTSPEATADLVRAGRLAADHGAWVFLPEALDGHQWHDDPAPDSPEAGEPDDVGFIAALIDTAATQYHIDPTRVYAAGYSNGAFMAERLACDLADRVAAVGVVAATLRPTLAANCRPARVIPVAIMMGTTDPVVAYDGNSSYLSAEQATRFWVQANGCDANPVDRLYPRVPSDPTSVTLYRYGKCTGGGADVRLYSIGDGGHTWPSASYSIWFGFLGNTTTLVDATMELWNVFRPFSLPGCSPTWGGLRGNSSRKAPASQERSSNRQQVCPQAFIGPLDNRGELRVVNQRDVGLSPPFPDQLQQGLS